jgi:predicted RNA-binding protein with RPS1 domain
VGDRIEAKVTLFNKVTGKLLLSIKDMESEEQEAHIYSGSSGTNVGDVLKQTLAAAEENKE